MSRSLRWYYIIGLSAALCQVWARQKSDPAKADYVAGDLITFNNNGTWCWFQDERAVIDTGKNKLVVGSVSNGGNTEAVIYDISEKKVVSKTNLGRLTVDDHNAPGFLVLPNGQYLAIFADHYDKYNSHYCIYNGTSWTKEKKFDWTKIPGGTNYTIAYSNIYYLSDEKQIYNFARANNRSPNFILSRDSGQTWTFGGQLSTDPSNSYNKGYYKYWGNGKDRIDFSCTEQHPRDYTTSIYHGYIKGGKSYNSQGVVADSNIFDAKNLPTCSRFTKVFDNGTTVNGAVMGRCWESDMQVYEDSTIAILFKARANNSETDHRNFYSRYDGKEWKTTYIGKAGTKMYAAEEDYTGLGALCPNDPNTIYLSSPFNPGDDNSKGGKREIWKGVTEDHGATWKWTAVTANSSKDNFRPIVPAWNKDNTALLWWRGTYTAAQKFNAAVVGVFYNHPLGTIKKTATVFSTDRITWRISCPDRNRGMVLHCSLPEKTGLSVSLFTASGKSVANYYKNTVPGGIHSIVFSVATLPAGMYVCRVSAGAATTSRQVIIR
jgi:hypothetical protein